jgi:O-antigen ligase
VPLSTGGSTYHRGVSSEASATATAYAPPTSWVDHSGRGERVWAALAATLPGLLTVYLGFESGGYYAGSVALAALVVLFLLIARVLMADRPFAGIGRQYAFATGAFALYTGWTLLSAVWSHAEARALKEFDRDLLYLLLLVLFGLLPRAAGTLRWAARSTAAGALIVCGAGLITRVLPQLWPIRSSFESSRLSYPVTYWNALGILAAIGSLIAVGLTADPRERPLVRAVAAGAVPIFAATLILTLSRGAIGAVIVGLLIFVLVTRTISLMTAVIALAPATAVTVAITYRANLLTGDDPKSAAAVAEGHHVALAVVLCAVAAFALSLAWIPIEKRIAARLGGRTLTPPQRRFAGAVALAGAAAVALIAIAAGWVSAGYNRFVNSGPIPAGNLSNQRLASLNSDGRTTLWSAAWHAFKTAPIHGTGAGTYEFDWYRYRAPGSVVVVDAHNLYVQVLAELGVVGLVLLVATLLAILVSLARGMRSEERVLCGALLAASVCWCLHAAVDWDWQMPAVTAWLFMIGGAALTATSVPAPASDREPRGRIPMAVGLLIAAVTPALLLLSEDHLQRAANAFQAGNCHVAEAQALASINDLAIRPEPYQIIGYCDLHQGSVINAVTAMKQAIRREPGNWQYHYGLAVADGYAGLDPRPALRATLRLDRSDPATAPMVRALDTTSHDAWLLDARAAADAILVSDRLTLR